MRQASPPPRRVEALEVLRGIAGLALFRADGIARFSGQVASLLSSLAPLLALPAVFALLLPIAGGGVDDLSEILSLVDALLVQLVVSEALARYWGREAQWGRYAVAFNWAQWAVPPVALALTLVLGLLVGFGLPADWATEAVLIGLAVYALALQCFVARHGLELGWLRAAAVVAAVDLCTALVVLVPTAVQHWLSPESVLRLSRPL